MRQQRVTVVALLLLAGFAFIELRLLRLQLVEHDLWQAESQRSTRAFESLPAERGWLLDRNGEPLARTEETRDLVFRFRDWRQAGGAVAAHLMSLLWVFDQQRRPLPEVMDSMPQLLDAVGGITVAEIGAVQPRQRRSDVLSYLEWIYGSTFDASLRTLLKEQALDPWITVSQVRGFAEGRAAALRRAQEQDDALADLGLVAGMSRRELLEFIDGVVRHTDERVTAALAREAQDADEPADAFRRARELHTEFDADTVDVRGEVSHDTQTLLAVRAGVLRGFSVRADKQRVYPERWADTAALLVGRLGAPRVSGPGGSPGDIEKAEANRERLAALAALDDPTDAEQEEYDRLSVLVREVDYRATDQRGLFGLESALEPVLRGKRGWISTQSNDTVAESMPPQRGLNVVLTLDVEIQQAAERALDRALEPDGAGGAHGWPGALVLLDPRTGEVLALASSPRPTRADLKTRYGDLLQDPWGPLCNRALGPGDSGNLPPPGSTFKPLEALVALRDGLITPHDTWDCNGGLNIGGTPLRCTGTHPGADLRDALVKSCNVWFYRMAEQVGGAEVLRAADLFGYGRPTGLLAGNEALASLGVRVESGLPESSVKLVMEPEPVGGEAMRCAIGQARIDDVTPLQVAVALGALGHGTLRPPQLVQSIEGYGDVPARTAVDLGCTREQLDIIRSALAAVVDSGTAATLLSELDDSANRHPVEAGTARLEPGKLARMVAGKTGTAQVGGRAREGGWVAQRFPDLATQSRDAMLPDHSWFAGYLPRENPTLAFAILLEHTGRHGGDACVPVLADLLYEPAMQRYLTQRAAP